jgi:TolB-like protein
MWRLKFCFGGLVEGGGNPISKDRLIESARPGLAIEESNLTVQIAVLRRVFAEELGGDSWIETLPRRSYRYVGPVAVKEQENEGAAGNAQPALALPDKSSLAVLPFTNMSGDPEQEYFADGMVEEIITGLSRIKWLFVIARNSSFTYKGHAVSLGRVGRELGVRYVLEGSVRTAEGRVRSPANWPRPKPAFICGPSDMTGRSTTFSPSRTKSP